MGNIFCGYRFTILIIMVLLCSLDHTLAQGIKGKVKSNKGEILPFASIYIRNLNDGVPTNQSGEYEFRLQPGLYDVVAQYLGYATQIKTVQVRGDAWTTLDFELEEQVYALKEVTVKTGQEDPALTIMRKAISKAKFHRLQVQEYSMMVYLKGTGQLTNVPFFLKKELAKEGIKINEAYTSESVSKITFKQPNTIEEKVISIRTSGDNNQASPAPYLATSFYQPKINESITPLSPAAFTYYKFTYQGSFVENGVMVNKIKVTPRSRGENVFEGHLYIIEDLWAIHSLDLQTSILGFKIGIKQLYQPVAENVWMPSTHTYTFSGKVFGFAGEYKYLASTKDYKVTLNPDLIASTKIIDEKIDEVPKELNKFNRQKSALEQMAENDQMTRKDFRKLVNQYEKEQAKERQQESIVAERLYSVDSLAKKRDMTYWDSIRPVKLTLAEIKGYERDDSLAVVEAAKLSSVDSIAKKSSRKFRPLEIFTGGQYFLGKGRSVGFDPNLTKFSFNTVEGFKVGLSGYYRISNEADSAKNTRKTWIFRPEARYGFASETLYGNLQIRRSIIRERERLSFGFNGGSNVFQFNGDNPISEQVNAFYSLFLKQNFMKLYEQHFLQAYIDHRVHDGFTYRSSLMFAQRNMLENNSDFSYYRRPERLYSSNIPENIEAGEDVFQNHRAVIWSNSINWRPGIRYYVRNGRKIPFMNSAPLLELKYTKGIPQLANDPMAADFDWLELGIQHGFKFGVSGKLDFNLRAGSFFNSRQVYFMDYKHFGGNRTIFANMGVATNYRFLDYYQYSTTGNYLSGIVHYQFRKFLLTQLPMLRFSGVKENIFFNYLKTENSPHYWELGYSLDNLFRLFRLELGAGFENNTFQRGGMRFGIASIFNIGG